MIFYLLILSFILGYGFLLYFWGANVSWRLNAKTTRSIKSIHYFAVSICCAVAISFLFFDIGLRGLWTTRSIIIISLVTGVFFKFVADAASMTRIESWYFRLFSFLPFLISGLLFVPFMGIVFVASLYGQLTAPADKIYFEDEKIRIQSTFVGVLGPPRVDIYRKDLIFEKHLQRADYWASEIDSISVAYDTDSTRIAAYGLYNYETAADDKTEVILLGPMK